MKNSALHVGIIMDGNGRWAQRRGMPRPAGHAAGARAVRSVVESAAESGNIGWLTLYAFSSDNWLRPPGEVDALMSLFADYLEGETPRCVENGIRIRVVGRRDRLAPSLVDRIEASEAATADGDRMTLRLAVDYSARDAIVRAAERALRTAERTAPGADAAEADGTGDGEAGADAAAADGAEPEAGEPDSAAADGAEPDAAAAGSAGPGSAESGPDADPSLCRERFRKLLGEAVGCPEPVRDLDLLIRTGGEQRLSDFLLWEAAYAELYFTSVLWPDFGPDDLADALADFNRRDRRFGRILQEAV